jgi:hypothetical protein
VVNTLWIKSGFFAIDGSNNAILCDHCPCGDYVPCCGILSTTDPAPLPATMYLTVSGPDTSQCPCVFGTFALVFTPGLFPVWKSQFSCNDYYSNTNVDGLWQLNCFNYLAGNSRMYLVFACVRGGGFAFALPLYDLGVEEAQFCATHTASGSASVPQVDWGACCLNSTVDLDWTISP